MFGHNGAKDGFVHVLFCHTLPVVVIGVSVVVGAGVVGAAVDEVDVDVGEGLAVVEGADPSLLHQTAQ